MTQIVKVKTDGDRVVVTVKVDGKEITHTIITSDPCIGCPLFVGQCACNCNKLC